MDQSTRRVGASNQPNVSPAHLCLGSTERCRRAHGSAASSSHAARHSRVRTLAGAEGNPTHLANDVRGTGCLCRSFVRGDLVAYEVCRFTEAGIPVPVRDGASPPGRPPCPTVGSRPAGKRAPGTEASSRPGSAGTVAARAASEPDTSAVACGVRERRTAARLGDHRSDPDIRTGHRAGPRTVTAAPSSSPVAAAGGRRGARGRRVRGGCQRLPRQCNVLPGRPC